MWKRQILAILEEIENDPLLLKLQSDLHHPLVTEFLGKVGGLLDRLLTIVPPLRAADTAWALRQLLGYCGGPALSAYAEYLERALEVATDAAQADRVAI
jgi:hypothetical protein